MANTTGKKYGGRKAGTANKVTRTIREAIAESADAYFNGQFHADIMSIEARDRLAVWVQLMQYVTPKMKAQPDIKTPDSITISLAEIAERRDDLSKYTNDELTALQIAIERKGGANMPSWLSGKIDE